MTKLLYEFADRIRMRGRTRRMTAEHALGRQAEDLAHRYLQRAGIVIVARNYRSSGGTAEIDLVGWDKNTLVFVEVKSRQNEDHGAPDRAVGSEKWVHIVRAARDYARHASTPWQSVRFDIVNVVFTTPPTVTHLRDALPRTLAGRLFGSSLQAL